MLLKVYDFKVVLIPLLFPKFNNTAVQVISITLRKVIMGIGVIPLDLRRRFLHSDIYHVPIKQSAKRMCFKA